MEYPTINNPSKAPSFLHEFDSRVMPGRRWEPGMTISKTKTPATPTATRVPVNPMFPKTSVMRPC